MNELIKPPQEQIDLMNDLNALFKGALYARSIVSGAIRLGREHNEPRDVITKLKAIRRNYDIMVGTLSKLCKMSSTGVLTDSIIKKTRATYETLLNEYKSNYNPRLNELQ